MQAISPQLSAFVQEAALSISAVVNLDVTVVDGSLRRIAGTGSYRTQIGERLPSSCSFGLVSSTGKPRLVSDARIGPDCARCGRRQLCQETGHLAYPLTLGNSRGVLSLVAFSPKGRDVLLTREGELSGFLRHTARMVAMAAQHQTAHAELLQTREALRSVSAGIGSGVLAVGLDGTVLCCNAPARRALGMEAGEVRQLTECGSVLAEEVSCILRSGVGLTDRKILDYRRGRPVRYLMTGRPLLQGGRVVGALCLLRGASREETLDGGERGLGASAEALVSRAVAAACASEATTPQSCRQAQRQGVVGRSDDLAKATRRPRPSVGGESLAPSGTQPAVRRADWEQDAILAGLRRHGDSKGAADLVAAELGLSRSTIYRRIRKYRRQGLLGPSQG